MHDASVDIALMQRHAAEAAALLKTLASPVRLRILCELLVREMNVSQINAILPELSPSALSQHLARLRVEQLVQVRRESQKKWYSVSSGPAQAVIATLYDIYCSPS